MKNDSLDVFKQWFTDENKKQNPAKRMDYLFYKEMAKKMEDIEEKVEGKEEKGEKT